MEREIGTTELTLVAPLFARRAATATANHASVAPLGRINRNDLTTMTAKATANLATVGVVLPFTLSTGDEQTHELKRGRESGIGEKEPVGRSAFYHTREPSRTGVGRKRCASGPISIRCGAQIIWRNLR